MSIGTAAGTLAVQSVRFTDQYPPGCSWSQPTCLHTDGDYLAVMTLHPAPGKSAEETYDALIEEYSEAYVEDGSGDPVYASVLQYTSTADTVDVVFELNVERPPSLTLYWPNNGPKNLPV